MVTVVNVCGNLFQLFWGTVAGCGAYEDFVLNIYGH